MKVLLRIADRLRRMWWRAYGPRTIGVRGVVSDGDGRVLLVRHSYGPLTWHLPGGGVKRRESLTDAVLRELREEVGIEVPGGTTSLTLIGAYSNLSEGKSDHIALFRVEGWERHESSSAEVTESGFFPPDDPPPDTSPGTRRRLEELAGKVPVGFRW